MRRIVLLCCLSASVVAAPAFADPASDVRQSFDMLLAASGFRGVVSGRVFGPELPAMTGEIDVLFPDRIHARTNEIEFISLPSGAWISALGLWTPVDRSLLPVTRFDNAEMRRAMASIRDVRVQGKSKTAQCAAQVFRFRASGQLPGANADGNMRLWVCDANHRPARLEATDAKTGERVVVDFDWSRRPQIEAPSR